jgi:iron complex outermembrane recepter protein
MAFMRIAATFAAVLGAGTFLGGVPAIAQTGDQPSATRASSSSSDVLQEVVVTARRREERAQTVPIAINVISPVLLKEQNITNPYDLANQIPGLTQCCGAHFDNFDGDLMRGVRGVQNYIKGVPIPYSTGGNTTYFDVGNIQVLKGPQGTLFGGSNDAGSILYEPVKPTNNFEGYVMAGFGDYNHHEFEAVLNVPIIADKLLVRVGGEIYDTDGYIHDLGQDKYLNDSHYWNGRATITFRPTDNIENEFFINYFDSHNNSDQYVLKYYDPHGLLETIFPQFLKDAQAQVKLGYYAVLPNPIFGETYANDTQWTLVNTTSWDINENLTFKNIFGYVETRLANNYHSTPDLALLDTIVQLPNGQIVPSGGVGGGGGPHVQYSEEAQLIGKAFDSRLNFVFGTFNSWYGTRSPLTPTYSATFAFVQGAADGQTERTNAVYAQGTYDLSDWVEGLSFTGGYRYTWDKQYHTTFAYNYYANGAFQGSQSFSGYFHKASYTLGVQYQLSPDTMIYITNAKGFQTGGFTTSAPGLPPDLAVYQPESLNNIELGVKSDFDIYGIKGRANLSGFYGMYDNIQAGVTQNYVSTIPPHPIMLTTVTENAADAHISGIDGEFTIVPTDGVSFYLAFEYLADAFERFQSPVQGDLSSAGFFLTPKWKYVLRGTFDLPVLPSDGSLGVLSFTPSWTWQSGVVDSEELNPPPGDRTGEYGTLNASVTWKNVWGRDGLDLTGYATNLLDNPVSIGGLPVFAPLGFTSVIVPPPRMFGFNLKYKFNAESTPASTPAAYTPPPPQPVASAPRSYLVFFDFNKSDLTSQAQQIVDQAASNAGPAKVTRLTVTGHTDTVGSDAYNMRLSRRRAESVAARLEKDGIASSEIEIVAKGKRDLLVPTADGVREPQNRRVQIVYDGRPAS